MATIFLRRTQYMNLDIYVGIGRASDGALAVKAGHRFAARCRAGIGPRQT
jgi:hypothetical protein